MPCWTSVGMFVLIVTNWMLCYSFSATRRRTSRRCRWRTLPSHRRLDPGQFASKGKPTYKTQPNVLHFYFLYIMYLSFKYYINWVGIIVVVLGKPPYTLYPSTVLIIQLLPSHVHLWHCGICNGGPRKGCNRDNCLISVAGNTYWYERERSLNYPERALRILNLMVNLAPPEMLSHPERGVDCGMRCHCCCWKIVELNWGLKDSLLVPLKPSPTVQPQYPGMGQG